MVSVRHILNHFRQRSSAWLAQRSLQRRIRRPRKGPAGRKSERVLIFAPEAGLLPHFHMMCLVAKTLEVKGYEIWVGTCFDALPRCPVIGAHQAPISETFLGREKICRDCVKSSLNATEAYGLNTFDFRTLENEAFERRLEGVLGSLPEDLYGFTYDGIEFGKLCVFEVCVGTKKTAPDSRDPDIRAFWTLLIRTALKSYFWVSEAIRCHGFTHVAYFNDYSLNLAAALAAEHVGAVPRLISQASHRNVDRRRCIVYKKCMAANYFRILERWSDWRGLPLSESQIGEVAEDTFVRFSGVGSHIYSPPKASGGSVQAESDPSVRRIVAYTSSPDEWAGAAPSLPTLGVEVPPYKLPFGGTIETCHSEWLVQLANYLEGRQDIELIIRIHPREDANKRENKASSHLVLLREKLSLLPSNTRVVWPQDPVSSYDLAESADLILTSWSTIGLEMARLGVPVLTSTFGVSGFVADDFHEFGTTPEEYFSKLEFLLGARPDMGQLKRAYRWWNLFCLGGSVDFSDVIPQSDYCGLPEFRLPAHAADLESAFMTDANIFDINRAHLLEAQDAGSDMRETASLMLQCRRLLRYLVTHNAEAADAPLLYLETVNDPVFERSAVALASKFGADLLININRRITYVSQGKRFEKFSPMAARLGFLGCTHACVDSDAAVHLPCLTRKLDLTPIP